MNEKYPIYIDKYDDKKYIQEHDDYIIAKGGDGTLLKAIIMHRDKNKPFMGVAAGTVNFLMNKSDTPAENAKYKKFNLIRVKVTYRKRTYIKGDEYNLDTDFTQTITEEFQAFNDVMIGGDMNSWIDFRVKEKDEIFGDFTGGGLIISTPQGSTGINKNNGGIILPLRSKYWSITGDKTNRPIEYVIKPKKTIIGAKSRSKVTVWVDGSNHVINDVIEIEISKGDEVTVIFNNYKKFKKKRRLG
jgi:NAD+ kinase